MQVPVLLNFLSDVPLPLTSVLVLLAPQIAFIKSFLEIISWNAPWYQSWLLLAFWWLVCLIGHLLLRYMFPFLIFLPFVVPARSSQSLVTEVTLQNIVSDLQSIQSLLPSLPPLPKTHVLTRILLLLYVPMLALTHCIRLRILIAMAGTLLVTHRAPWAIVLRKTLWRSAHIRWMTYNLWSHLSGQLMPLTSVQYDTDNSSTKPMNILRFLFTVYENQRWWMGLDWTAALLPGERPSWCSAAQYPVSPPNAFSLPKSTTVTVTNGKGMRVRRTAIWRWEEPEWRVMVRRGDGGLSRVERPLPSMDKEGANRFLKGKGREPSGSTTTVPPIPAGDLFEDNADDIDTTSPDPVTDSDGWVYGDNKWENQSSKGGMSKYTRFRRWTRVATVHEIVEPLHEYKSGDARDESTDSLASAVVDTDKFDEKTEATGREFSPLRQRLINTLMQPSSNAQDEN